MSQQPSRAHFPARHLAGSLERVEDQIETELELGSEVVARLEDVPGGELRQVRVGALGRFTLDDVPAAIGAMEAGTLTGKALITVSS